MWGYTRGLFGYRRVRRDVGPPELDAFEEDVETSVALEDIEWVEIITLEEDYEEDVEMDIGLEDITWQEVFTVTFDNNHGDTEADPETMDVGDGDSVGELPTPPTKDGYTFEGWNTQDDGDGDAFDDDTVVTEDVTVYAVWEEEE